jgi:MYXO-CTERM domain-containing protein
MFPRHDGKYQIIERHGTIAISDTLCGHYVKQSPTCAYTQSSDASGTIYPKRTSIPGVSNPAFTWQEDPHIWRSGGTYHVVYSGSGDRVGWHLYSSDGLSWKDNGYAWSPRDYQKIFCYEGSTTCNAWYKMERPGVVLEDGHPTHITWAVSDVDKDNQVLPGTNHGTKVVVVPFDGVAFDNDFGTGGSSGTGGGGGGSGTGGAGGRDGGMGSGSGGATGAGGRSGSDGGPGGSGSGGATGTGGLGTGGTTGTGGLGGNGSGGASGSGGRSGGSGGTTAVTSGGSGGSGGAGTGGVTAGGGVTGAGGATPGSGGKGTGGAANGAGGAGNGSGGQGGSSTATSQSGCSCALQGSAGDSACGWALLLGFALVSLVRRRRR